MKLKDIATISTGFPFDGTKYSNQGIRVVRGENIGSGDLKWDERLDKRWQDDIEGYGNYSLQDNDIVMQMDGNVGKNIAMIKSSDLPMLLAQRVARLQAKEGYNQWFVYFILRSRTFFEYITRITTGTSIQHISLSQIGDFEIDGLCIEDQDAIASVLSSLDRKIALNRKANEVLESMAKQLYDYWFVQFNFPNAEGKPYKSSGGKMVYNETLKREIPEGWEVLRAEEFCKIRTGKEDANFSTQNGNYPFFTCSRETLMCDVPAFDSKAILLAGNGDFNVKHYTGKFNAYQRTYVIEPDEILYWGGTISKYCKFYKCSQAIVR